MCWLTVAIKNGQRETTSRWIHLFKEALFKKHIGEDKEGGKWLLSTHYVLEFFLSVNLFNLSISPAMLVLLAPTSYQAETQIRLRNLPKVKVPAFKLKLKPRQSGFRDPILNSYTIH